MSVLAAGVFVLCFKSRCYMQLAEPGARHYGEMMSFYTLSD